MTLTNLELRSLITPEGRLKLWLEDGEAPAPRADDDVVIRVEAAPLNPSDILLLLGPSDLGTLRSGGSAARPQVDAVIPPDRLAGISARMGQALAVGNEGAGVVVEAGPAAAALVGRLVAFRATTGSYSRYQLAKAADCIVLPDGVSARDGAAAFINPLTALGMVETMRREGHSALVHTAAASNLGQMLNRLCRKDGVPLVNIVRSAGQATLLRDQGAEHVLDSSADGFRDALAAAIAATGATLAFDAIGGGAMAATILAAMESVTSRTLETYSRYGSPVHKQVYVYGMLDSGPRILEGQFGMAWGIGGWLMTWFYERIGAADAQRLRARVAGELTTTFASRFTAEIGLAEALEPDMIRAYSRRSTGEKYLIAPQRA